MRPQSAGETGEGAAFVAVGKGKTQGRETRAGVVVLDVLDQGAHAIAFGQRQPVEPGQALAGEHELAPGGQGKVVRQRGVGIQQHVAAAHLHGDFSGNAVGLGPAAQLDGDFGLETWAGEGDQPLRRGMHGVHYG